jgi:L,D-transpeptidase catalytic domain
MPAFIRDFPSPAGLRLAAGLALAATLGACATAPEAPALIAHTSAVAAPPPPMFLDGPYERVPVEGKAILVNIPSYELVAFEDGREVMRSRVIVGTPTDATPQLIAETSVVRFRPTWTPTPDMIEEEGLSPETRPPGKNNPLGLMAIRLDPGLLIYLHGTNSPKLFGRDKRALSHGCIRVEKVEEVAAFVLGTTVDEVRKNANGRRTFDMDTDGIPVLIRYHTRFPDETGVMREYADVYGRSPYYAADYPATGTVWRPGAEPAIHLAAATAASTIPSVTPGSAAPVATAATRAGVQLDAWESLTVN